MSTLLLYHGFGVRGYQYQRTEYVGGKIMFTVVSRQEHLVCPDCGQRDVVCKGVVDRLFRSVPIAGKKVLIKVSVQRVGCRRCGTVRQVKIKMADPYCSYTKSFRR